MTRPTPRRDLIFALLIAAWAHVGLFFFFVVLMFFGLLSGKVIEAEQEVKEEDAPINIQVVYEDVVPVTIPAPTPLVPEVPVEPEMEDKPAFVQTQEDQTSDEPPEETNLIGERDTSATSDEGAVAGDEKLSALAGEEDRKSDPKTFDSNFSKGDQSGPSEGMNDAFDTGQGLDEVNEQAAKTTTAVIQPIDVPDPKTEETLPTPKKDELASIDQALALLDEEVGDGKTKEQTQPVVGKVEETMPDKPATKEQEAADQDGGFAPRARKTRIAGVINASGKGSLNVSNTAIGRYQAAIFKKLETAWQMENISNRSLLAPGNVTLYFMVDKDGKVSGQRQVSMIGASGTQWGMILRALNGINIPKMPSDTIKELQNDPLEIIVTFNYQ